MPQKIWFITGISGGLGKAIAETAIESGAFVAGSFRNQEQADSFNIEYAGKARGYVLDIIDFNTIENIIGAIKNDFGRLDVLVNNAGFGFAGAVEEATIDEVRKVFEVNIFGTLKMTQAVLPLMRAQKSGHIIQMSSQSGFKSVPGFGIYNASKFALEGFSEALAAEVEPLGIKVTLVEPGPFRTNFAGSSFSEAKNHIADYDITAGVFRERMHHLTGKQEGDPAKAAKAILQITEIENPPLRLPLGKMAVQHILSKIESVQKDVDHWREVAEGVVFEE